MEYKPGDILRPCPNTKGEHGAYLLIPSFRRTVVAQYILLHSPITIASLCYDSDWNGPFECHDCEEGFALFLDSNYHRLNRLEKAILFPPE